MNLILFLWLGLAHEGNSLGVVDNCAKAIFKNNISYSNALINPQLINTAMSASLVLREGPSLGGPVITTDKGSFIIDTSGETVKCSSAGNFGNLDQYMKTSISNFSNKLSRSPSKENLAIARELIKSCSGNRKVLPTVNKLRKIMRGNKNNKTIDDQKTNAVK